MNKKVKVALNMTKLSVPDKINRARFIVNCLTGNSNFTTPNPTLSTIVQAINNLEVAWNNAADGGKTKTALMHDAENALMNLMSRLAHYVEDTAANDENKIHSSGMDIKKPATATNKGDFYVEQSEESGVVIAKISSKGIAVYFWETSTDEGKTWTQALEGTQSRVELSGLTPGQKYLFRVRYTDKEGPHPYSESLSLTVV